jgi:hypothetical protein
MNTMKGKMVCLSFWWKASEADWGWYWLSLVEMIAISVTSPDLGDADDILLGLFQAVSSKGTDQADVILNLLEQYNIVDQTFVCCDTTSSNTNVFSGAIVLLCPILNTPLVVSLQEAHAGSKHLSLHWVLHWREDQGPLGGCVSNFRRSGQQSRMRLKTL